MTIAFALLGALWAGGAPPPVVRDTTPPAWSAALYYDALRTPGAPTHFAHTLTAAVQRKTDHGSVALQAVEAHRFGLVDRAAVVDAYHDLWRGAYGNVRVQYAGSSASALPELDAGAELFQAVGQAELSASYRRQIFALTDVDSYGAGLGYYTGYWYLRQRSTVARIGGSWSPFFSLTARRYLNDAATNSVDVSLGIGKEVLDVQPAEGAGAVNVIATGARFAGVRAQHSLTPHLGALLGASYSDYDDIPDRWGASLGIIARW